LAAATFPSETSTNKRDAEAIARLQGQAHRGEEVYFSQQAGCSSCHVFHGRGGEIGPDLSAVRSKYGTQELLRSILEPNAAIAFGYDSWLLETTEEEVYSGFILSDGDTVVVKDTQGRRHAIPRADIAARKKQTVSVMPDGVALGLSDQQVADLVAFLREDPKASGKPAATQALFNGQDLSGWVPWLSDSSVDPAQVWSVKEGVLRCVGTPAGYIRTEAQYENFVLELEWRFDPAHTGNSGVLMRMTGPDRIWPRSIEAQLMHRNAGDIWNIGEVPMQTDAARQEGQRTRKALPCNEVEPGGWNRYRITLDGGELTLEVNGEVQNRATWCERRAGAICLQSEGAQIEFRNIRITPLVR
jgi:putative heme-binding domain-containing protein